MTHPVLADVVAELVSPSGQRIRLMGPTAVIPPSTSFITWDIQFNASNFGAFPDAGFDPVWNNLNLWLGFQTYVGTYLPHQGNLEDFNSGSVNGEWKLEFIDVGLFGEGELLDWNILFCSTAGLTCNTCDPAEVSIDLPATQYCQFDTAIVSDLQITEVTPAAEPSFYEQDVTIFAADTLLAFQGMDQLTNLVPGTYTICGVSYLESNLATITSLLGGISYPELLLAAAQGTVCLSLSEDCVEVEITEVPEVVTVSETICRGQNIIIGGESVTEPGTYTVRTPSTGCDSVSFVELTVIEKPYTSAVTEPELSCAVLTSEISLAGLATTDTVEWSTMDGFIISDAAAAAVTVGSPGTYMATVTSQACSFSEEFVITASDDYVFAIIETDTLTCNTVEVLVDLQVDGAVDSVRWTSTLPFAEENEDIRVSSPGLYLVDIFTPECQTLRFVNVIENIGLANIVTTSDTLNCDSTTATIFVEVMDAGEYTYQWLQNSIPVGVGESYTTSVPGSYEAVVMADNGCSDTVEVAVVNQNFQFDVSLITDTITCDVSTVPITYTANAAADGAIATWTSPSGQTVLSDTVVVTEGGDYMLNLRGEGGCEFDTTFAVVVDTMKPNIEVDNTTFPCAADSLQLDLRGASLLDEVLWVGESFTSTVRDPWVFTQGDYTVTVTRPNGCMATLTVTVDADGQVPDVELLYGELDCVNDEVLVVPSDTINFDYEWELLDGTTVDAKTLVVTEEGDYGVKVMNEENGCFGRVMFYVRENKIDTLDQLSTDTLTCTQSEAVLVPQSSVGVSDFMWMDQAGSPLTDPSLLPGVNMPGIYFIDFTLENGCTGRDSVEVLQIETAPIVTATSSEITCDVPTTQLVASVNATDYTIFWTDPAAGVQTGDSIVTGLAGTYQVVVVAEGNCTDTTTAVVLADTMATQTILTADGAITCLDDAVIVSATYGATPVDVTWTGPEILNQSNDNISVSGPGLYTVTTTGANGCIGKDSIEVISEIVIPQVVGMTDTITCADPIAQMVISTESTDDEVIWEDVTLSGPEVAVFDAGTYAYTVTNPQGCEVTGSLIVPVDTITPSPVTEVADVLDCATSSVEVRVTNVEPLTTYEWDGPGVNSQVGNMIEVSNPGTYTLLASNPNGCFVVREVTVEQDIRVPEIEATGDSITCNAGKSILNVSSDVPLQFVTWAGPNDFFSQDSSSIIIEEGVYYVEVIATNGCLATDSIEIIDVQVFPEVEIADYYLNCDGVPIEIAPTMLTLGSSMRWIGPGGLFLEADTLPTDLAGEYIGLAVNEDQCVTTDTFQVIDEAIPPIFDYSVDTLYCFGDIALTALDVEDDRSVLWVAPDATMLEGETILSGQPGFHDLIVTGTNGCRDTVVVEVVDGRIDPVASIALIDPFECLNQFVRLSGSGSSTGSTFSYSWSTADGTVTGATDESLLFVEGEGTYKLVITDSKTGCMATDSLILVQEQQSFQGVTVEVEKPTCRGFANGIISVTDFDGFFPPYTIELDGQSYGLQTDLLYLYPGTYDLVVTDSLGCQVQQAVVVEEGDYPTVTLPADTVVQIGDTIAIAPHVFPDTIPLVIEWNIEPPCGPDCLDYLLIPTETTYLSLIVTDENGCSGEDDILVTVSEREAVRFPNVFSPNGDRNNDIFYLPYRKGIDNILQLRIYDWNGTLVFGATDIQAGVEAAGWDGSHQGQPALQGVYLVEAVLQLTNGEVVRTVSDVTLVR